jgi:tetratricopeptide (TPR) repeat protein
VVIIPLMGALHLRYPQYNAVSVRDTLAASRPEALALTPLTEGALDTPSWQDTPELALPLSVAPWAKQRKLPLYPVFEPSPDAGAYAEFQRFAEQYPQLRDTLATIQAELRPLAALLEDALTLPRIMNEVIPILRSYQLAREAQLEEGPATDWWRSRMTRMAERILALPHRRVAVLASAEHIPFLADILTERSALHPPEPPPVSEESRIRSLLDYAFQTDVPEPGNLIAQLRQLELPEARYHEANLLLANGHLAEALELLRDASKGNFSEPYYLPGFLLARLGQLYDLAGERAQALRCYRGVKALSYAPQAALEAAEAGLAESFQGGSAALSPDSTGDEGH